MLMRMRRNDHSNFVGGNIKWHSHFGKVFGSFLTMQIPYGPITSQNIYPREIKIYSYIKTGM